MEFEEGGEENENSESNESKEVGTLRVNYAEYTIEELNDMLNSAISSEDYEKASKIRDEINKRKK